MPFGHATVLGGLPVIAEVWFSGPDYFGEYDAGVDCLYWQKRDGSAGAPLSERMMERIEKRDPYWQCEVTEQVSEQLAYENWVAREGERRTEREWAGAQPFTHEAEHPAPATASIATPSIDAADIEGQSNG